jgi:hypothetical protein
MLQGDTFGSLFLDPSVLWACTVRTLSKTSNNHALCYMLNHGNTLVQLPYCLSLSSCQLESTLPSTAQLILSQSQQCDLVGHHLPLSNVLEKISRPTCELLYATNTSHHTQETFLMNILCTESFCPQKRTRECCSSVLCTSSTVTILTTETSL